MTLPARVHTLFRLNILLVAFASALLAPAQAASRNHDLQTILIPAVAPAAHDHAPGPMAR